MLKDHFIPHEGNAYQPHFLRFEVALALLAMVLTLEGIYLLGTTYVLPKSENFAAIFASVLVEQTNVARIDDKLGALAYNPKLEYAAKLKAEDMAMKGYFAHNSPDGKTPWYFFKEAGYDYAAAGENLAVNFTDSKDVTEAWMRSPSHRANIMNGNYTEIGIATAMGTYKGKSAIFVVQEFGRPSIVARNVPTIASSTAELLASVSSTGNVRELTPVKVEAPTRAAEETTSPARAPLQIARVTTSESVAPIIAGVETEKLEVADQIAIPTEEPAVATVTAKESQPSFIEQIIASPRNFTTNIFIVLVAIITLALGLTIFIKIRVQYPHMIANAVLLVAIILSIVLLNFALGFTRGVI